MERAFLDSIVRPADYGEENGAINIDEGNALSIQNPHHSIKQFVTAHPNVPLVFWIVIVWEHTAKVFCILQLHAVKNESVVSN
jgi:hypothetical protein